MSEGWIKLHRSIKDWQHYQEPTVMLVWIDLLLSANARGELFTSVAVVSKRTGLDAKTIRKALDKLESSGEIVKAGSTNGTEIVIQNFSKYQGSGKNPQPIGKKSPTDRENFPNHINKNSKNISRIEEEGETPAPARAYEGVAPIFERPNPRMMDAKTYGTFQNVRLTDSEMQTLKMRLASEGHDEAFLQRCIDRLSAYMAQEGRTYNNHLAAILNWAKVAVLEDDRRTGASQQRPAPKAPTEADNDERRRVWFSLTEEERQQYLATHDNKPPYDE